MIDPPKRTGYRLTYDAECLYNDWQEIGGCSCHTGCAPCGSCCSEGNPISLEENDEAWELDYTIEDVYNVWKLKQGVEMSRSSITDKSEDVEWVEVLIHKLNSLKVDQEVRVNGVQTLITKLDFGSGGNVIGFYTSRDIFSESNPKNFWGKNSHGAYRVWGKGVNPPQDKKDFIVGKYYKCTGSYSFSKFVGGCYYKLAKINGGLLFTEDMYNYVSREGFDINSESDYDPNTAQPAGYTAYVVFKQDFTEGALQKGEYGGKEYAYKCSFEDRRKANEQCNVVFAEVVVNGVEKKVKVLRIEANVDPKATRSIVRILPKDVAKDVKECKIGTPKAILEAVNFVHDFKPNDFSITKEEVNMSIQRKSVKVELFDNDQGLPVEHSLVGTWDNYITEDSDSVTIQEIISTGEVADLLNDHNSVRIELIDEEILTRTGNSVNLRPVKLKNLTWMVDGRKIS